MAACLPGEPVHQRPVSQAGDHRCQHDEPAAQSRHVRVRNVPDARVVGVAGQHLGQPLDHVPERDRAEAGADPHDQREDEEPGTVGPGYPKTH